MKYLKWVLALPFAWLAAKLGEAYERALDEIDYELGLDD